MLTKKERKKQKKERKKERFHVVTALQTVVQTMTMAQQKSSHSSIVILSPCAGVPAFSLLTYTPLTGTAF